MPRRTPALTVDRQHVIEQARRARVPQNRIDLVVQRRTSERQAGANAAVDTPTAAARPSRQGQRSDEHAPVMNFHVEHRKPRSSCAPIDGVEWFILELVEDAKNEIYAAGHVGVHQSCSRRPKCPSYGLPAFIAWRRSNHKNGHSIN